MTNIFVHFSEAAVIHVKMGAAERRRCSLQLQSAIRRNVLSLISNFKMKEYSCFPFLTFK